jgi:hypothetical protein
MDLTEGDFIGVFNNQGRCYGLARWKDTINFHITVYGNDGTVDGFNNGDSIRLKIWLKNERCTMDRPARISAERPLVFANSISNRVDTLNFERLHVAYPGESYCLNRNKIIPSSTYKVGDLKYLSQQGLDLDLNTGVIDPSRSVPGNYSVLLNTSYCLTRSEINVLMNDYPRIQPVRDTLICGDKPLRISLSGNFNSINWHNGATANVIEVTEPSPVWYRVTNAAGCMNSDTFVVRKTNINRIDYTVDKADCYKKGSVRINESDIVNGVAPFSYRLRSRLAETDTSDLLEVSEGVYFLEVINTNGCVIPYKEPVIVEKDCLNDNPVFSPNDDGLDDRYFINLEGHIKVFDRNGTLRRRLEGPCYFDGKDETGTPLPMGTYLLVPEKGQSITLTILR